MSQIRKKLNGGNYTNITDMTSDLYQMIDNAKKAFPPIHKANRDAIKMQKMLNQKLIDADQDDSDMEDGDTSLPSIASASSGSALPKKKGRPKLHTTTTPTTTFASTSSPNQPALLNPTLPMMNVMVPAANNSPKGRFPNNPILKKKLLGLQKFLTEFTVNFNFSLSYTNFNCCFVLNKVAGRRPMLHFLEKPSKKLYPDYYEVIQHPIDMNTIEMNIKTDRYGTLDDVVGDFRLMFANCRKYNEEGSIIYEDSNILERALNEKLKEFSGINDRRLTPKM